MAANSPAPLARRVAVGTTEGQWVALGRRGWVYWHHPDVTADVRLRLAREGGTWKVASLWVDTTGSGAGIPTAVLRLLTFGPVEALAADPQLGDLVGSSSTDLPDLEPGRCPPGEALARTSSLPLSKGTSLLAMEIPPASERDELWYMLFMATYAKAAERTRSPAKAIAEASGEKVKKIHAIYREAKRRQQRRDALQAETRAENARREDRLMAGLKAIGIDSWEDYLERFGEAGDRDPLGVWDEDGAIVGPPEDLDLEALEAEEQ